jgi:PAS domain S-box-containing protein
LRICYDYRVSLQNVIASALAGTASMEIWDQQTFERRTLSGHWLFRYGLAVVLFAATLGISLAVRWSGERINLTIPVVMALVLAAWYGGRGPGILISVLFQTTTIIFYGVPPDSTLPKQIFSYFSVFSLYMLLVFLISGLRKTQQSLRRQRDLLQVTLSSIGDAVITTDTSGTVTFLNPAAERMTGWTLGTARGRPLNDVVGIINEDTREPVVNPAQQVLEKGEPVGLANHSVLITKDGKEIPIDDSAAPISEDGRVRGVVMVLSDVSARKKAEKAKREAEIMQRIVEAQESERNRIARDLHDHLGQRMTSLRLRIESLIGHCRDHPELRRAVDEVQTSAEQIDRDIGFLSWELRPTELEELGLVNALKSFVKEWSKQYSINAEFHSNFEPEANEIGKPAETNLYRIMQEALNNVLKHAGAANVNVLLQRKKDAIVLIVEDDGSGFHAASTDCAAQTPGGLGVTSMRERAALLGGTLEIDSEPGRGTTIIARVPLNVDVAETAPVVATNELASASDGLTSAAVR